MPLPDQGSGAPIPGDRFLFRLFCGGGIALLIIVIIAGLKLWG